MNKLIKPIKIIIACDHSGIEFKKKIIFILKENKIKVIDVGVNTSDSMDYPDIVQIACEAYKKKQADKIILICGTGIGVSIAANKIKGIHCALIRDSFCAKLSVQHNHVNCISLGARVGYQETIENILVAFLSALPEYGRHQRRVEKVFNLEK